MEHPKQDAYRAIRYVREHHKQWGIDPAKIGVTGCSAGSEAAAMAAYGDGQEDHNAADPVDRQKWQTKFSNPYLSGPGFTVVLIISPWMITASPPVF